MPSIRNVQRAFVPRVRLRGALELTFGSMDGRAVAALFALLCLCVHKQIIKGEKTNQKMRRRRRRRRAPASRANEEAIPRHPTGNGVGPQKQKKKSNPRRGPSVNDFLRSTADGLEQ